MSKDKKPHKHAEIIKAWANGAFVQRLTFSGQWVHEEYPQWRLTEEYRIYCQHEDHVHADLICQWADGAEIQVFGNVTGQWADVDNPAWDLMHKYRIKPERKKYVFRIAQFYDDYTQKYSYEIVPEHEFPHIESDLYFSKFVTDVIEVPEE